MNNVLITGGLGYIGSHTASILAKNNIKFLILDNLSNCKIGVIERLGKIIKRKVDFIEGDIRDINKCSEACKGIDYVLHQAALGSVPRSLKDPKTKLLIFDNGKEISWLDTAPIRRFASGIFSRRAHKSFC